MTATRRPGPRERLLSSARELTYRHGIGVGVDAILEDADVARGSLYKHFDGKDGLIAATLRATTEIDLQRYRDGLESGGDDPRSRVLAVFDRIAETTASKRFRGCRYAAAELAFADPRHPGHAAVRDYKQRLHDLFQTELEKLGHPAPGHGADQIVLLIDGVLVDAVTRPEAHPALAARELAECILGAGPASPPAPLADHNT
jgi:AcrR family transcriptional regulator